MVVVFRRMPRFRGDLFQFMIEYCYCLQVYSSSPIYLLVCSVSRMTPGANTLYPLQPNMRHTTSNSNMVMFGLGDSSTTADRKRKSFTFPCHQ
jgi:hypothetical protein